MADLAPAGGARVMRTRAARRSGRRCRHRAVDAVRPQPGLVAVHGRGVGRPELSQGHTWSVRVVDPATPLAVDPVPTSASLPEAVAYCYRYLHGALRASLPADPATPMPVPQQAAAAGTVADTTATITEVRRLAAAHPGEPVTVRFHPDGTHTVTTEQPR